MRMNPDYGMDVTAEKGVQATHAVMGVRVRLISRSVAGCFRVQGVVQHKRGEFDVVVQVDQDGLDQLLDSLEPQSAAEARRGVDATGTAVLAPPADAGFGGTFLVPERAADGHDVAVLEAQDVWAGEND